MADSKYYWYPTVLGAVHLIVLYTFLKTIVDLPLTISDYLYGTHLSNQIGFNLPYSILCIIAILIYGYKKSKEPLKKVFPLAKFQYLIFIPLLTLIVAIQFFLQDINIWTERIIPIPLWVQELFAKLVIPNGDKALLSAAIVVFLGPISEELIFRGVIMRGFLRNYSPTKAIITSAIIFSLYHLNPWQMPATLILGLVLGFIRYKTRNILAPIIGHIMHNGLVFLSIKYTTEIDHWMFFRRELYAGYTYNSILLVISILLLIFMLPRKKIFIDTEY